MYLMYVDDSGDPGNNPQSHFFVLSGLVIHESQWNTCEDRILTFRRELRERKGLKISSEIHASDYIAKNQKVKLSVGPRERLHILSLTLDFIATLPVSIITVRVDKRNHIGRNVDIFDYAWSCLITRFHTTLSYSNFPGESVGDHGLIISDNTNSKKLNRIVRKLRVYNPVSNDSEEYQNEYRNIRSVRVIEDANLRDSRHSQFIQLVDVVSYFARITYQPNKNIRKYKARNYYKKLAPVVNTYATRAQTKFGIVEL